MGKQRPTASPAAPSWAGLFFEKGKGEVTSSTMASAKGGDGKNDVGLVAGMDQNEVRAYNQTGGEKLRNGLVKLGGTALTSFAEPFADILVGVPTALTNGGDAGERVRAVYDNGASQAMDSLNEYLAKEFPHYYSEAEKQKSLWGQLGTANFWADKVGNGAGFMIGAIASGALTGGIADAVKAGRIAKGVAGAAKLAEEVLQARKEGSAVLGAVEAASKTAGSKAVGRNLITGIVGSMGESGMEGRQIAKDTGIAVRKALLADKGVDPNGYEDYAFTPQEEAHIKDLEEAAGNVGFGVNMVLTGVENALLLPKVFRKGYQAERVALGAIEGSLETGYKVAELSAKKRLAKTAGKVLLGNLEEATQEQLQFAVEKGLPDYFRKQRDPEATTDLHDMLQSTITGMSEAYGTKEGWENALLGGIIGIAGARTAISEASAGRKTTQAAVDTLNASLSSKPQQAMMRGLVATSAFGKEKEIALLAGEEKEAHDAAFGEFSSMVRAFSQAGKLEDLVEQLQKTGEMTPEEFKELNGFADQDVLPATPAAMAAKQVEKAKQLHNLSEQIEAAYVGDGLSGLRDAFFGIASKIQNNEGRERSIANELAKETGISLDALLLTNQEGAHAAFKDAVEKWANAPSRTPLFAKEAIRKANDLLDLAEERIGLANMYKALEDPQHRQAIFAAGQRLFDAEQAAIQEKKAKEAADKAAATAATAASTAPVGSPATAPAAGVDAVDADDEEENAGAFGASLGKKPAAANGGNVTPLVDLGGGSGKAFATLNPDGTVASFTQPVSFGGAPRVYTPEHPSFGIAAAHPAMIAAVEAQRAAMMAANPANSTPPGATPPAAAPAVTQEQKDTVALINGLKVDAPELGKDGKQYETLTDKYDRATGLKKTLLSPRTNSLLSAEDVKASQDWLALNPQFAQRGNLADILIREFFIRNGVFSLTDVPAVVEAYEKEQAAKGVEIWKKLQVDPSYYEDILKAAATLKGITDQLGWVVMSDVATLHGEINGQKIAGTTDLVAVLPNGDIVIIDLKTNGTSRRADYKKLDLGQGTNVQQGTTGKYMADESKNREGDLIQQATYEELLNQRLPTVNVVGRYIFPLVTKDTNNVKQTGLAVYKNAQLEVVPGKTGIESVAINLQQQGSVGQKTLFQLGGYKIGQLITYYSGTPGRAAQQAVAPIVSYASATENGILVQKKHMAAQPIGNMPLLVTIDGDTAKASLSPAAQEDLQKNGTSGLEKFFPETPLPVPNRGAFTYEVDVPAALVLDQDKNWRVDLPGHIILRYADGTTSDDVVAPKKNKAAPEDTPNIGPEFYSRLQGAVYEDWNPTQDAKLDDFAKKQVAIREQWKAAMKADPEQRKAGFVLRKKGNHYNVFTQMGGKEVQVGYLSSVNNLPQERDLPQTVEAYDEAVALRAAVDAYAEANPGADIPLLMEVRSNLDSKGDVRTDKSLAELDARFTVAGKYEVVEQRGQYREEGGQRFTNALTGQGVRRNTSQELADANMTGRYAIRVQAPGGEFRWIGANTKLLTDEKTFADIQAMLSSKATEKEKAAYLNEHVFLSHKGPFKDGARPGIRFIGSDKGTVSAKVYVSEGVGEDGNPKDTVVGYLRFTAKFPGNKSEDFLNAMAYFPVLDGKEGEALPATEVAGAVRSQLLASDTEAQRLAKLVPSTSEQLWDSVTPYPKGVDAQLPTATQTEEKKEEAAAVAAQIPMQDAAPKRAAKRTTNKTRKFDVPSADEAAAEATAPMKIARTSEVLGSDEFAKVEAYVESKLPTGPTGFSVREVVANATSGGVTVGYFLDMGIHLATSAPTGTGYHEAFHGVFRVLLNASERAKYYALARRNTDLSEKAKAKFRKLDSQYANLSDARLEMEMLEETMADLFSQYVLGKAVPMSSLFQRIQAFLKWLFMGGERPVHQELRELFATIDNGGFKNSTYRDSNSLSKTAAKKTLHFLNAYESERAVRLLSGDYMRLKASMGDAMTSDELLEDVLDTRKLELMKDSSWLVGDETAQEAQLKERRYYRATAEDLLDGEIADKLYPIAFAYEEDRQSLKQEILKTVQNLSRAENLDENSDDDADAPMGNDPDEVSERNFDLGQLQVENKPGKEVKTFLLMTTYVDAEGVRQPVDYKATVDLLYRVLDNTRTFSEMYRKIRELVAGGNQPQMMAVLENITSQLATANRPYFKDQFRNAFYRIYADPRVTTVNAETGKAIRFDANRESTELKLMGTWRESVENKAGNINALRKSLAEFTKVRQTLDATDSTDEQKAADEVSLVEALGSMGLDISTGLVHNALAGLDSEYTWKKVDERRSLEEDLTQIADQLFAGYNPFLRSVDEPGKEKASAKTNLKAGSGATARGLALATADARYRQDLMDASGQDAAGKPYFARAQPAMLGERGRDIHDGTYRIAGKPWLTHNLVARYERSGATVRNTLRLNADLGIREETADEGLTPKDKDPKTYWLEEAANFRSKKGDLTEREITPFQLEAKSSSATLTIPTYAPGKYFKDGALTEDALEDLYYMAYQDLVNGELALKQLYGMNPIAPIEGTHFLKRPYMENGVEVLPGGYDADGNPRLISKEKILEFQNSGQREKLPRIFQVVSLPSLNKLSNAELRNKERVTTYLKGYEANEMEEAVPSFHESLMEATKAQLAEVGLSVEDPIARRLLMGTDSGYKNIDEFLGDMVMTNLLWSDAYFRLVLGSEAYFANHVDTTKRMALLIAAGPSMGEGSHRFAALETHDSYLDAKTLLPITKEQYKVGLAYDKENKTTTVRKADATDAQVYWTADMAKRFYQGIGKLNQKTAAIYDKVIAGEPLTRKEQLLLLDEGVSLISAKGVYASQLEDGTIVYLKFSAHILSPELTSFKDKDGNWHAKPDMEGAHNLATWMKENRLDAAGHDTSFKVGLRNKNFRDSSGNYAGEAGFVELPNNGLREQMQNPSGKRKIVYPTQVLQLLDEGMQDDDLVELDGETMKISAVRDQYQGLFAEVRSSLMEDATIATEAVVSGNRLLVGQILSTLEASGAGPSELSFFQHAANEPDFLHSTDLPALNKRFQKLFLALYNKGALSLKAPGSKYTLVTSGNTRVVVGPDGALAHDWGKDYADQDYWTEDFKLKPGYSTRELRMHGPESDEAGAPIRMAEVYLSEELLLRAGDKGMTLKELYSMDEASRNQILSQLGVRIPFQSHHSAMPFKVVGWVPAHYGSVAIAPAAITTLSGADYDIDSLYVLRKEFWQSADRSWHVYGEGLQESVSRKRFISQLEANMAESLGKKFLSAQDRERYASEYAEHEKTWPAFRKADLDHHLWEEYHTAAHSNKTLAAALRAVRETAEWKDAAHDIHEIGQLLSIKKDKNSKEGEIRQVQNEVEPLLRTIRHNLWAVQDETSDQGREFQNATALLVELASGQTALHNKLTASLQVLENLKAEAHKQVGVAFTEAQFKKLAPGKRENNYNRYSGIMDANFALMLNPANAESIVTPAETAPLEDAVKAFAPFRNVKQMEGLPYSSITVRSNHQFNNLVGKANIGPAALANTVSSLLTKHRYQFMEPFYFMGQRMRGYASNLESDIVVDKDGKVTVVNNSGRKANSLSTLVSAMADNAKERLAAKLNLTRDNLMALANLVAMGYGLQRTMLFAAQPAMEVLSQKYRATQSVADKNQNQQTVLGELVADITKRLRSGKPAPSTGLSAPKQRSKKEVVGEVAMTLKELRRALVTAIHPDKANKDNAEQIAQFTDLSQRANAAYDAKDLRGLLKVYGEAQAIEGLDIAKLEESQQAIADEADTRGITAEDIADALEDQVTDLSFDLRAALKSVGALSEEDFAALKRQRDVLFEFNALLEQTKYFKAVSTILSGNKGVGSDFTGLAKINRAREKTSLPVGEGGEVMPAEGGIYLEGILHSEHGLRQNLDNIDALSDKLPDYFLSRTPVVQNIVSTLEELMPGAKEEDLVQAELDANTFLGINAYQVMGESAQNGYRLTNFNELFESEEDNLGKKYEELLSWADKDPKAYGWLKKNLFLRNITVRRPDGKNVYYGMTFNTRQKVSPEFSAKLDEAVRELMGPSMQLARDFIRDAVRYLATKDNFQYKNGTFVGLIPETQFRGFSKNLKAVHDSVLAEDGDVKNLTGYDVPAVRNQFMYTWFTNPTYRKKVLGLNGTPGNKTKYGGLSDAFTKVADREGMYFIDVMTLPKSYDQHLYGLTRFPSFIAINRTGDKPRILKLYQLVKDKNGDYVKGQAYYEEVPELPWNERSYYHLNKAELQAEAKKRTLAAQAKASAEAREDLGADNDLPTLQMQPNNIAKIVAGKKTATSRTAKLTAGLYQLPGGVSVRLSEGARYENISQMKDAESWAKAEGFTGLEDMRQNAKYQHTKDFINGKGSLWVYQISLDNGKVKEIMPGVLEGDIFAIPGIPVITTNLGGVHGAGLAQAAAAKGLLTKGDGGFKAMSNVIQLPVKKVWSDSTDIALLTESLSNLDKVAKANPTLHFNLPLAGIGHGEGDPRVIIPLLAKMLDNKNITLVLPAEGVNLGRQGTVKTDKTRELMPLIKELLAKELGISDAWKDEDGVVPDVTSTTMPTLSKVPSFQKGQKTMRYAGIGSRTTPQAMMERMTVVANRLKELGYTLASGGAEGADKAFERGAGIQKNIFYAQEAAGDRTAQAIVNEVHPNPGALGPYPRNLMARNAYQVFGKGLDSPVDFVLAWTPDGIETHEARTQKSGGTGQAISLANLKGIPVINLANPGWEERIADILGASKGQPAEWKDDDGQLNAGTDTFGDEDEGKVGAFGTSLGMKAAPAVIAPEAADEYDEEGLELNGGAFAKSLLKSPAITGELTPFVRDLLDNWEDRLFSDYHGMTTDQRIKLAKGLEDGTISTTCLMPF